MWWTDDNLDLPPVDLKMLAHSFREKSSLACSDYVSKRLFIDYREKQQMEVAEILKRRFCVHDLVKSVLDLVTGKCLINDATEICGDG